MARGRALVAILIAFIFVGTCFVQAAPAGLSQLSDIKNLFGGASSSGIETLSEVVHGGTNHDTFISTDRTVSPALINMAYKDALSADRPGEPLGFWGKYEAASILLPLKRKADGTYEPTLDHELIRYKLPRHVTRTQPVEDIEDIMANPLLRTLSETYPNLDKVNFIGLKRNGGLPPALLGLQLKFKPYTPELGWKPGAPVLPMYIPVTNAYTKSIGPRPSAAISEERLLEMQAHSGLKLQRPQRVFERLYQSSFNIKRPLYETTLLNDEKSEAIKHYLGIDQGRIITTVGDDQKHRVVGLAITVPKSPANTRLFRFEQGKQLVPHFGIDPETRLIARPIWDEKHRRYFGDLPVDQRDPKPSSWYDRFLSSLRKVSYRMGKKNGPLYSPVTEAQAAQRESAGQANLEEPEAQAVTQARQVPWWKSWFGLSRVKGKPAEPAVQEAAVTPAQRETIDELSSPVAQQAARELEPLGRDNVVEGPTSQFSEEERFMDHLGAWGRTQSDNYRDFRGALGDDVVDSFRDLQRSRQEAIVSPETELERMSHRDEAENIVATQDKPRPWWKTWLGLSRAKNKPVQPAEQEGLVDLAVGRQGSSASDSFKSTSTSSKISEEYGQTGDGPVQPWVGERVLSHTPSGSFGRIEEPSNLFTQEAADILEAQHQELLRERNQARGYFLGTSGQNLPQRKTGPLLPDSGGAVQATEQRSVSVEGGSSRLNSLWNALRGKGKSKQINSATKPTLFEQPLHRQTGDSPVQPRLGEGVLFFPKVEEDEITAQGLDRLEGLQQLRDRERERMRQEGITGREEHPKYWREVVRPTGTNNVRHTGGPGVGTTHESVEMPMSGPEQSSQAVPQWQTWPRLPDLDGAAKATAQRSVPAQGGSFRLKSLWNFLRGKQKHKQINEADPRPAGSLENQLDRQPSRASSDASEWEYMQAEAAAQRRLQANGERGEAWRDKELENLLQSGLQPRLPVKLNGNDPRWSPDLEFLNRASPGSPRNPFSFSSVSEQKLSPEGATPGRQKIDGRTPSLDRMSRNPFLTDKDEDLYPESGHVSRLPSASSTPQEERLPEWETVFGRGGDSEHFIDAVEGRDGMLLFKPKDESTIPGWTEFGSSRRLDPVDDGLQAKPSSFHSDGTGNENATPYHSANSRSDSSQPTSPFYSPREKGSSIQNPSPFSSSGFDGDAFKAQQAPSPQAQVAAAR